MSEEQAINFTREAFLHPVNLGMLLIATISAFVLSDVGMLSSLILTMAFGTELMYLGILPRLPRYRKRVKYQKLHEQNAMDNERSTFQELDAQSQKRFLTLKRLTKLVKENFDKLPYSSQGLLENIRQKIQELVSNYLTLLDLHKRYQLYMNTSVEESLKVEVQKEERKMENMQSERLKRTTNRRVGILKKRLKKFEIAKEKYLICETHLETIEDAIQYIYEQSMTMSKPEEIGFQLDNLLEEVEETSQLIDDMDREILPFNSSFNDLDLDAEFLEMEKQQQTGSESSGNPSNRVKE
ncbi:hypothetical protein [Fodinibius salsisoli]|uniref:5-bromo-4-chloroindolyl phosphate hydrolysis protein n=1 Tax=Fodinibius salsisoli TaxID=2820877 RepID=A0ABT3PPF0_9BACT|nr:hypothetical protein [Fodinibius salsisoli]MCW9707742.1 hypothetical protein [Fodinibius salsisoli]